VSSSRILGNVAARTAPFVVAWMLSVGRGSCNVSCQGEGGRRRDETDGHFVKEDQSVIRLRLPDTDVTRQRRRRVNRRSRSLQDTCDGHISSVLSSDEGI
jgi:hypothetical protein